MFVEEHPLPSMVKDNLFCVLIISDDDQSLIAHSVAFLVMGHPSCHQLQDINRTPKPAEKIG